MENIPVHRPQILIVEDDSLISELIKRVIENEDRWQPTTVQCGKKAIEAWNEGDFDVILMDIRMSGMDGIEATKNIREHERLSGRQHIPIIAFTVMATKEIRQRCIDAGMDDFISKPYEIKKVVDTIYRYLPESSNKAS